MYPKVKVKLRNQGDILPLRPLKVKACCESSSEADVSSIAENNSKSTPSTIRIPDSYIPIVVMPTGSTKSDKDTDVDERQSIRATSYFRPRAVLSSPENDRIIGEKNSTSKEKRSTDVKKHSLIRNRHVLCKVSPTTTPCQISTKIPSNSKRKLPTGAAAAATNINNESKGKKTTGKSNTLQTQVL